MTTANITNLKAGTLYTYKAYKDSNCSHELTSIRFTTPGIVVNPESLIVDEGGTVGYTVKLTTKPTDNVTITISPESGSDSDVSIYADTNTIGGQTRLTFTEINWNTSQTIAVSSNCNTAADGTARFKHTAASNKDNDYDTRIATITVTQVWKRVSGVWSSLKFYTTIPAVSG